MCSLNIDLRKEKENESIANQCDPYKADEKLFLDCPIDMVKRSREISSTSSSSSTSTDQSVQTTSKSRPSSRKIFGTVSQSIILVDTSNRLFFYEFLLPRHFPSIRDDGNSRAIETTLYREGVQSYFQCKIQPFKIER